MKTIAKLMALLVLVGAFGFSQAGGAGDSKKDDQPQPKKSNTAGTSSTATSAAKTKGTNPPGGGKANLKNVMLTADDCKALGGQVSNAEICESGKVCTVNVYDPQSGKGYYIKQRCISKQ